MVDPKAILLTARMLWGAILLATLFFVVILQIVPLPPDPQNPVIATPLAVVALSVAAASFVVPKMARRQALSQAKLDVREEADPGQFGSFYREAAPKRRVFADPAAARRAAATTYMTSMILSVALSEAVALFGFVLAFLGFSPPLWAPIYAAGLVLVVIRFPTERRMVGPLEAAYDAVIPDEGPARP